MDGTKEWEKEFNLDDPKIVFGENNIYVYEKPTGDIYFLNERGETVERIQLETKINNIVESYGSILIYIKKANMESINILDKEGKIIENTLIKNGNILTCSMAKDNATYSISTLNLKDEDLRSEIQVFKIGGEPLFTHKFINEILLYSNFIEDNKLIVMTDKSLYSISEGNVLWEKQIQLIKDINVHEDSIDILFGNTLDTISMDGKVKRKYSFSEEYKKIITYNKYLVIYGDEYIMVLEDGKEIYKYRSEDTILKVIQGKQNLIVIYEDRIELISL